MQLARPYVRTVSASWAEPDEHLLQVLHSSWYRSLSEITSHLATNTFEFFRLRGLSPALMPITCGAVSSPMGLGSDSVPVEIELFGCNTYLADSMQFQLELLVRHLSGGTYYIMPTFRGEDHDDTHLNQFFHSEAEIQGDLEAVMSLVEDYVGFLTRGMLKHASAAIAAVCDDIGHLDSILSATPLPRITYREAHQLLSDDFFKVSSTGNRAITRAGEQALIREFGGAVWLTHPPASIVPFYQASDVDGNARSADLLMGLGEVVGCGERCTTGDELRQSIADHSVDPAAYAWYIQMKDVSPMRTAGFGLGVERFLLWLLKHDDIRDLSTFPRLKGIRACI